MNAPAKEYPPHFYSDLLIAANRAAKAIGVDSSVMLEVAGMSDGDGWRAELRYYPTRDSFRDYVATGATPREAVAAAAVMFFVAICKVADAHAEAAMAMRQTITPFLTPENTGT